MPIKLTGPSFVFSTQQDVLTVKEAMCGVVERFGFVTVADLNCLLGIPETHKQSLLGWKTLTDVMVTPDTNGWRLTFPEPICRLCS